MKPTPIRPDGRHPFGERTGVGVRASASALLSYDLTVVATDVRDVVAGAGGWLYDRVRAGWKVTVVIPASSDARPLEVLGVRTVTAGAEARGLATEPAALAVPAHLLDADPAVRRHVVGALKRGSAEVTIWGDCTSLDVGCTVGPAQYRLGPAARAFKTHALAAAGLSSAAAPVEHFHSRALWYPADGPDLTAIR
ncbi:hypothetical protein V4U86_16985 [Mycobacterium sp. AMU20-3851]|uniref:hypothetical protein n=1 Tax=Mycobacterium sp. AMU20-3851 TaxID=3122055 RepID=UPI003754C84D